ncbi:MAG: metalloregulator ArsR/SmtB family transcription factor [Oscillospiraceae bacterium]|nr:metalloregulator ArsR/SmtB family transcription factor [Oscillospiraceae bacterium]
MSDDIKMSNETELLKNNSGEKPEFIHAHDDLVEKVYDNMPEEEILYDLAELYKVFGDSTRIKILYVLFESEMCVYDIARLLNMTQSAISHQLKVLKQSKLVRYRREGKTVFYSLADDHVRTIIDQGMEHISE